MIDSLESLLQRCDVAEQKYDELLRLHQSLIHEYEVLRERYDRLDDAYVRSLGFVTEEDMNADRA